MQFMVSPPSIISNMLTNIDNNMDDIEHGRVIGSMLTSFLPAIQETFCDETNSLGSSTSSVEQVVSRIGDDNNDELRLTSSSSTPSIASKTTVQIKKRGRIKQSEPNNPVEPNTHLIDAEAALDMIRLNCMNHSDYHSHNYRWFKRTWYLYRVPIIVISACNAFIASTTQPYIGQTTITTINTVLSLVCGIITSLELFFNIQLNMESERKSHKEYYALAVEILEMLLTRRLKGSRGINIAAFAEEKFQQYLRINRTSNIIEDEFEDILSPACPIVTPVINTTISANSFTEDNKNEHSPEPNKEEDDYLCKDTTDLSRSNVKMVKRPRLKTLRAFCSPRKYKLLRNNTKIAAASEAFIKQHIIASNR